MQAGPERDLAVFWQRGLGGHFHFGDNPLGRTRASALTLMTVPALKRTHPNR